MEGSREQSTLEILASLLENPLMLYIDFRTNFMRNIRQSLCHEQI